MSEEEIDDILEEIDETWGLAGKKAIVNLINKHENLIYENISLQKELDDSISKDKVREIVEKSYNDIDYFKRDIIKDLEELLGE